MQAAQLLDHLVHRLGAGLRIGDVESDEVHTRGAGLLAGGLRLAGRRLVAGITQRDRAAVLGEAHRGRAADAARGPRDQR